MQTHFEPITDQAGGPLDLSETLGLAAQWAPVLGRILACDPGALDKLVRELVRDEEGEALFDTLSGLDALARRLAAASECFGTAHARVLVAADTLAGEEER